MSNDVFTQTRIFVKLDTKIDLSDATNPEIHWRKPDGTSGEWSGTIDGEYVTYNTQTSDIEDAGVWAFQAVVTDSGNLVKGSIVKKNFQNPIKTD